MGLCLSDPIRIIARLVVLSGLAVRGLSIVRSAGVSRVSVALVTCRSLRRSGHRRCLFLRT